MRGQLWTVLTLLVAAAGCSSGSDEAPTGSGQSSTSGGSNTALATNSGAATTTQTAAAASMGASASNTTTGARGSGGAGSLGTSDTTSVTNTVSTAAGNTGAVGGASGSGDPSTTTATSGSGGTGGGATGCEFDAGTNPGRICIKGKKYYLNGINVAWDQWTNDLTHYNAEKFESLFAALEASGGNSVRWWWFIDGENQLTFQGNLVQPLSQNIFDNLDAAFDAAAEYGILIMPVLLSFDLETPGRQFLLTDPAATDAFVTNVVKPLVERYNDHPGLGLWEIINEGDWLLTEEMGTVSLADYQRFHGKVAAGIHAADADALVTTGSGSFKYVQTGDNIHSDAALRAAAGGDPLAYLDVYQTHYYSWQHGEGWSYEPWIKSSTEWQSDGKPIIIGEFPCRGEDNRWTNLQMHVESVNQGFAGTFCWAYFDNRADSEGTWTHARPAMEAIAAQIPQAIIGE